MPDLRSPLRYLWWNARRQAPSLLAGISYATLWWLVQALMPAVLGQGIEAVTAKDTQALLTWAAVLFGLGLVQAFTGVMRHRMAVYNWLAAAYRTVQLTTRQAARLGATLPKRLSTGEVVSVGNSDIAHIGSSMDILLRGAGSVVAIITVTVILISTSLPLGLLVLFGVPLMAVAVGPLLKPLHRRQARQRELTGELSTRAADIVAGLRVLRGIGGEQVFAGRYREESQRVRHAGVRVARVESVLEGAQILLPGLLIAIVTGIGASFAVAGEIPTGQLVAFYLYAVFLIGPLRTLTEMADKLTKGHVAAGRVIRILAIEPEIKGGKASSGGGVLRDSYSGVTVQPGVLTAVAASSPEDAIAIADRLGRYAEGDVTFGSAELSTLPVDEVRRRILVADNNARLFTGRLRDELDIHASSAPMPSDRVPSVPVPSVPVPPVPVSSDGVPTVHAPTARPSTAGMPVGGSSVGGSSVVGASATGASTTGAASVGPAAVGSSVGGSSVGGSTVVGTSMVDGPVDGGSKGDGSEGPRAKGDGSEGSGPEGSGPEGFGSERGGSGVGASASDAPEGNAWAADREAADREAADREAADREAADREAADRGSVGRGSVGRGSVVGGADGCAVAGDEERVREALYVACAEDIVEALPDGLDTWVAEAGREFSGGQQQRLRLARALVADPEVLILVEPTSAVDAHSEARIARRLAESRAGRTTLICTTSPLVLDRTDHVIYVEDGRVLAEGTHRQLLDTSPEYASTVTRGED
ncbi:ABC transporter transmembrane domain-containing protein [Actinomadura sp. ATCC 31491]|uniref:ABC transporter transmembrane domain-containing protein n=1 Tax=Actinomadura luzonensis TaxID=2805427 RepID=A0ABT0FLM2_9ACTN|nr:ABC transporter transmembrane domain-containing protein [Actinomadura luzonensis]